jgi:hypothetical protein
MELLKHASIERLSKDFPAISTLQSFGTKSYFDRHGIIAVILGLCSILLTASNLSDLLAFEIKDLELLKL